ncbi:UvrD-helicase domain-containing protein [Megalodesulfovibrio gigas]|uniref:UvrD-helicase domain-containing protein n=1 Tax=Megalodesulfovibrio gigas TaxID=879 RepID=UPI00130EAAC0|nr:UvrD-helicase domain-containing protein [Megalodesulfovibrio gigas]
MHASPSAPPSVSESRFSPASSEHKFLALRAGAGSGKTFTLTCRFLDLLRQAVPQAAPPPAAACAGSLAALDWAAILAVTFTNKAAAEMQERVLRSLKERALDKRDALPCAHPAKGLDPKDARRWCEIILHRMSRLNIRTIDSLLFQLVRLSALPLGLPPDIEPVFDESELFDPLYDRLVDRARQDPALAALFEEACRSALDYGAAKGFAPALMLKERLAETLSFLAGSASPLDPDLDKPALNRRLEAMRLDCLDAARRMLGCIETEQLAAKALFVAYLEKVLQMAVFDGLPNGVWPTKESLDDCLNKGGKGKPGKGQASAAAEACFRQLQTALQRHRDRYPIYNDALELLPLASLAAVLAPELAAMERRLSLLPKARWEPLVCALFSEGFGVSEAYCRLGVRLSHLLIDEFQDTSQSQWLAMEPLAVEVLSKGGSLFYVGDVKQAIYGWRGGDAGLFDALPRREELWGFEELFLAGSLDTNWRSASAVVGVNNALFSLLEDDAVSLEVAQVMLPQADADLADDLARGIRHSFRGTSQQVARKHLDAPPGLVQVVRVDGENAEAIMEATHEAMDGMLDDVLARRNFGDVAVLVRSNEQAQTVAQWLLDRGVPVVTENSLLLKAHPLVRQLMQFLAFLDYPPDDLAFWEVISGQELFLDASGLSHAAMVDWAARLARSRLEHGSAAPLFLRFQKDFPAAWLHWLQPFHSQAGILGPYDCLAELCRRFRLLERRPGDQLFLRRLLEVAHLAETAGHQSLSAFLDYWNEKGDTERAPLPDGLDAIRVLTIHKAKGLEFPAVIIPFHHDTARLDKDLLLVDADDPRQPLPPGQPGLLARRRRELGPAYHKTRCDSLMEALHVLYVAWTRPVEELHCLVAPSRATQSPMTKALLALLPRLGLLDLQGEEGEGEGETVKQRGEPPANTRAPAAEAPEPSAPAGVPMAAEPFDFAPVDFAPMDFAPMDWLPRLKVFRNELTPANFANRRRGTLLHRCLEHLRLDTPDPTPDALALAVDKALAAGLRGLANPHDPAAFARDRETVAEEVRGRLAWLLGLPEARAWLCSGVRETTILAPQVQGDAAALHKPDLLVLDGPAPMAVEYKSGLPRKEDAAQLRRYLHLLAAMHPGTLPPEGRLVYLDLQVIESVRIVAS